MDLLQKRLHNERTTFLFTLFIYCFFFHSCIVYAIFSASVLKEFYTLICFLEELVYLMKPIILNLLVKTSFFRYIRQDSRKSQRKAKYEQDSENSVKLIVLCWFVFLRKKNCLRNRLLRHCVTSLVCNQQATIVIRFHKYQEQLKMRCCKHVQICRCSGSLRKTNNT